MKVSPSTQRPRASPWALHLIHHSNLMSNEPSCLVSFYFSSTSCLRAFTPSVSIAPQSIWKPLVHFLFSLPASSCVTVQPVLHRITRVKFLEQTHLCRARAYVEPAQWQMPWLFVEWLLCPCWRPFSSFPWPLESNLLGTVCSPLDLALAHTPFLPWMYHAHPPSTCNTLPFLWPVTVIHPLHLTLHGLFPAPPAIGPSHFLLHLLYTYYIVLQLFAVLIYIPTSSISTSPSLYILGNT